MKKTLGFIAILISALVGLAGLAYANQAGDRGGDVLHTDIRVFIDDIAIMGYNINGTTYIVANHLTAHGFVVEWDEAARRVDISRGTSTTSPEPVPDHRENPGTIAFPFYFTDIITYADGQRVSSFNVEGRTVVRISEVAFAAGMYVAWDEATRTVNVTSIDFTAQVFALINEFRVENGLQELEWHEGLAETARVHSHDFTATTPVSNTGADGSNPFERVRRAGLEMVHVNALTARRADNSPEGLFAWLISNSARRDIILHEFVDLGGLGIVSIPQDNGSMMRLVVLKVATPAVTDAAEFERQVFELFNQERTVRGLNPLTHNPELADLARLRAQNSLFTSGNLELRNNQHSNIVYNNLHPRSFVRNAMGRDADLNILYPSAVSMGVGGFIGEGNAVGRTRLDLVVFFESADGRLPSAANPFLLENMKLRGEVNRSSITLPTERVTTPDERAAWIAEYHAMGGVSAFELELIRLVNEFRVERGLSPVSFDPTLAMAARYYTQLIIHIGYTTDQRTNTNNAHNQGPHGGSGATARSFGANIRTGGNAYTPGPNTPEATLQGWINSPGHLAYLIRPNHRFAGMGKSIREDGRAFHYLLMSPNPSNPR